jgi:hypothetical protein
MKKNALVTTFYCSNCKKPNITDIKKKFNYNGKDEDLFINFSDYFDPFNPNLIPNVGNSKRRDLIYGKIFKLRKFIEDNISGKYENLLHIDFSDTKFVRGFDELFDKFIESKKNIIISTEKNCWPYIEVVSNWVNKKLEPNEFHFLNSGAIISKTEKFLNILKKLEDLCLSKSIDFWDDQGVWQYYDLMIETLDKDLNSEYFFSTAFLDDSYYSIEKGKLKTRFNTYPFIIHDNSSFSLNLIKKF